MSPEWQFIQCDEEGGKLGGNTKKTVRENAMRAFRRRERLERAKQYKEQQELQATQDESIVVPNTGTFRQPAHLDGTQSHTAAQVQLVVGHWDERASHQIASPLVFDPFSANSPDGSSHKAPELLNHFIHNIATLQSFHEYSDHHPLGSTLITYALTDPILVESLVFHASVHLDAVKRRPWGVTTLYHQRHLVQSISHRLATTTETASDALIFGVAMLGACGNITGDVAQDVVHRQALQRMITMRGGQDAIGGGGTIAIYLIIGDLISVSISGKTPITESPIIDETLPPVFSSLGGLSVLRGAWEMSSFSPTILSKIQALIHVIARLAHLHLTCYTALASTSQNMMIFIKLCCAVEHRLVSIQLPPVTSNIQHDPELLVCETTRVAALLCSTHLFRRMRPGSAVFNTLHQRLRQNVESLDALGGGLEGRDTVEMLFWALCVGGGTALDPRWHVEALRRHCSSLGLRTWEEARSCLERYLWTQSMESTAFVSTVFSSEQQQE